jgi:predicted amidohydrolase YtcJ
MAARLAESGITTLLEAATTPEMVETLAWLQDGGGMTFRVRTALYADPNGVAGRSPIEAIPELVARFVELRERYDGGRLHVDGVKIFADGVIEGDPLSDPPTLPNAAVLEPYRQPIFSVDPESGAVGVVGYVDLESEACRDYRRDPGAYAAPAAVAAFRAANGFHPAQCEVSRGVLAIEPEVLRAFVRAATGAGFHVHIHAIGDRAVREAVAAFAESKALADERHVTQSLAHVQLVHPDDQRKIGELGIAVAFTYSWAITDRAYDLTVTPFLDRVEDDLYDPAFYSLRNVYPAASIQRHGGLLVAGSDAPVVTRDPRPFVNIAAAVFRRGDGGVLNAGERLSIDEAIAAYTSNGARLMGEADRLGSLEPGKLADLIVIDRDVVKLAADGDREGIEGTRVVLTLLEGETVWEAPGW